MARFIINRIVIYHLDGKTVAVIGYGSQGHTALNLKNRNQCDYRII